MTHHTISNTVKNSPIIEIYPEFEQSNLRFIVKFANNTLEAYRFNELLPFLNQCLANNFLSNTEIQKIVASSKGVIFIDDNICIINRVKFMELMDASKKSLLVTEFSTLSTDSFYPWFRFPLNFKNIVDTAADILEKYSHSRIFALGQSAAWIVQAARMLNEKVHKVSETSYIPFSGKFYNLLESANEENAEYKLFIDLNNSNNAQQVKNYNNFLQNIGMDPLSIMNKYNEKQKTVIIDFVESGAGLASFLSILFNAADKFSPTLDIMQAIEVVILDDFLEDALNKKTFTIENKTINCTHILVKQQAGMNLMWNMANGKDTGGQSDRLIPYYPINLWENPPPKIEDNSDCILEIFNNMQKTVDNYILESEVNISGSDGAL